MKFTKAALMILMLSRIGYALDTVPVESFVAHVKYSAVSISPDGTHLAVLVPVDGVKHLVFFDITDIDHVKREKVISPPPGEEIFSTFWINDERVVSETSIITGALEIPRGTGRYLAVNYDGGKKREIWSVAKQGAVAQLIDIAEDDPDHVIISHIGRNRQKPIVERLNVYTGDTRRIGISPLNRGSVLVDHNQTLRFAIGQDDDFSVRAAYKPDPNGDWVVFENPLEGEAWPVGISGDNKTVFVISDASDRMGLHALDLATGEVSPVAIHDQVETNSLLWSLDHKDLIGVEFLPGKPEIRFVNDLHEDRGIWDSLLAAFEGMHVRITSTTRDNSVVIVQTSSDTQPATYYHFDIAKGKVKFLVSARPEIDAQRMATTDSFRIKARDGLEFQLYVTKPQDAGERPMPTIMYIHGGPHGPRDEWSFNPETQLLASRGYTVIQPNYRGSGGFGEFFEETGYLKWYAEMQDDITDATLWAIEEGIADPDRICIYGASYGGFATLAGLTKEPDLYACGFAFVGVYDLEIMRKYGDIHKRKQGRNYLDFALGEDPEDLKARSPINHVSNIKAPLYIAHGKADVRAHVRNFYQLRDRLEEENIPFEQMLVAREGHGFYKMENRVMYANELLRFLDQHIGTGYASTAAVATQ
jgi:dipeptidyl aminopeptidase/acylaminoacyl peptidase